MRSSIGWYNYAWSPVIGCKHGCEYCYAKPYAERHGWIDNFKEPEFILSAVDEPMKIKRPSIIFACEFADLFGDWIPKNWIDIILDTVTETPHHTYVFLTKNPKRYKEFYYPDNVYLGVTVESPAQMWRAHEIESLPNKKLASIEPISGDFSGVDLSMFDRIVAGFHIYRKRTIQEKNWMKSIKHNNLHIIQR